MSDGLRGSEMTWYAQDFVNRRNDDKYGRQSNIDGLLVDDHIGEEDGLCQDKTFRTVSREKPSPKRCEHTVQGVSYHTNEEDLSISFIVLCIYVEKLEKRQ